MRFFTLNASEHEYNAMASFQTTGNIGKTQDKYCFLSFMHRNKIGLLTPFANVEVLMMCEGVGKKSKN